MEIRVMARRGESARAIAKQLDFSRNTRAHVPARARRAGPPALDPGDRAAARDPGTRLRGRHQPTQGVPRTWVRHRPTIKPPASNNRQSDADALTSTSRSPDHVQSSRTQRWFLRAAH